MIIRPHLADADQELLFLRCFVCFVYLVFAGQLASFLLRRHRLDRRRAHWYVLSRRAYSAFATVINSFILRVLVLVNGLQQI